jgi:hypothetical protein
MHDALGQTSANSTAQIKGRKVQNEDDVKPLINTWIQKGEQESSHRQRRNSSREQPNQQNTTKSD